MPTPQFYIDNPNSYDFRKPLASGLRDRRTAL